MRINIVPLLLSVLLVADIHAADISGTIELKAPRRLGNVSVTDTVVFFRPDEPVVDAALERRVATAEMKMQRKQFVPAVIDIDLGTEIEFPNVDRVLHNAFSSSRTTRFDLGLYGGGETKKMTFEKAGLVRVFCNVHQDMVGYVMVLDTPYHTRPNADGSFQIPNVQLGKGKLFAWHPRGKSFNQIIELDESGEVIDVTLNLTKRLVPSHKNKFGKPYRRNRDY